MTNVVLPRLSPTMTSAVVVAWLKAPGDHVAKGDALYEVETDKVVSQIEADVDGVLDRVAVEAGDVAKVGQVVAVVRSS